MSKGVEEIGELDRSCVVIMKRLALLNLALLIGSRHGQAALVDPGTPSNGGASLAVALTANATADDCLAIRHVGTGSGQMGVPGNTVAYGGTVIGAFAGGVGATSRVVAFNSAATPAAVQALLRVVTFSNVSSNPSLALRPASRALLKPDGITAATGDILLLPPVRTPTQVQVRFAGIVGTQCSVQRAGAVGGEWTTPGSAIVGQDGTAMFTDAAPGRLRPGEAPISLGNRATLGACTANVEGNVAFTDTAAAGAAPTRFHRAVKPQPRHGWG